MRPRPSSPQSDNGEPGSPPSRELFTRDLPMIECEVETEELGRREPPGIGRVVPASDSAPDRCGKVQNADRMTAGVAPGIRVNPGEVADLHPDASLFPRLARACALGRLAPLTESAG